MDERWGNPVVRRDPPRWKGRSFQGFPYSECTPDYLEAMAGFLDWQAEQDFRNNAMTSGNKPRGPMKQKDASLARGWALRVARGGTSTMQPANDALPEFEEEDEIPF